MLSARTGIRLSAINNMLLKTYISRDEQELLLPQIENVAKGCELTIKEDYKWIRVAISGIPHHRIREIRHGLEKLGLPIRFGEW